MKKDLTKGPVTKTMLYFAAPMILGNLLQQGYNIVDTLIVGRFLGADALAAVGSAYSLMTFLNAIMIGLCMGSGTIFSVCFGKQDKQQLKNYVAVSFLWIAAVTILLNIVSLLGVDGILHALKVPSALYGMMRDYVWVIFFGIFFTFLYNYFAFLLRALGNSMVPLCFLGAAAGGNILLDIVFVVIWEQGIRGAAWATVLSQAGAGIGIGIYVCCKERSFFPKRKELTCNWKTLLQVMRHVSAACVQQSVMNFGILMIQGLVNSFGASVMAAFAAAVKIDSFAYMPAQEFSNAFSLFIAQNYGSQKRKRMQEGIRKAGMLSILFCLTADSASAAGCFHSLLSACFRDYFWLGTLFDANFCRRNRNRNSCHRNSVFKNRRQLLRWNWYFISIIRVLSWCGKAGTLLAFDHSFFGNESFACLFAGTH